MPERAEIEAATDALLADSGLPRYGGHRATVERRVRIALEAAARVRDARGDDEAAYPPDRLTAGEAPRPAEWEAWQARSPQGEDHEGGNQ